MPESYESPVDGANDLPPWLKAITDVAASAATVAGLWSAKEKKTQQAVALEGNDAHPLANSKQSGTTWGQQALYWLGLLATGAALWYFITRR